MKKNKPVSSFNIFSRDIGPGNCLIDNWVRKNSDKKFDYNGEIAKIGNVNKPKTIPIYIFKFFAIFGDLFNKIGIKFPMTSYRLKNMTTDQVYNLQDTYNVCGDPPYNMKNAIENTLHWISNN